MSERPHKKLKIWNKTMDLIEKTYLVTEKYPGQELYGLSSQMRRASVSVASNIAEGSARRGQNEKIQFYTIARSSLSELDAQLEISLRLGYINQITGSSITESLDEVSRMLQGLIKSYEKN